MPLADIRRYAQLVREGVVESISADTVRRTLENHHLKPWRHHLWLSPTVPRDADFAARVQEISDLYTRALRPHEVVLCVDEKTNLQPRPRKAPTKAAAPGQPVRVEHGEHLPEARDAAQPVELRVERVDPGARLEAADHGAPALPAVDEQDVVEDPLVGAEAQRAPLHRAKATVSRPAASVRPPDETANW